MTRAEIVAEARSWLGTKWVHQHCLKGVAVDCAQMVMDVGRQCGLVPNNLALNDYGLDPDGTILRMCETYLDRVEQEDMQPGDVVVIAMAHQPQHVGIVGDYVHGGLSIIHASNQGRCEVIESRLMFSRRFCFVAAYAFRGVSNV
jgi:cell wall-associated NlpC family hydrolase